MRGPSRAGGEAPHGGRKREDSGRREILSKARPAGTVPETDTGRKDE